MLKRTIKNREHDGYHAPVKFARQMRYTASFRVGYWYDTTHTARSPLQANFGAKTVPNRYTFFTCLRNIHEYYTQTPICYMAREKSLLYLWNMVYCVRRALMCFINVYLYLFLAIKNEESDFRNMKIERDGDTIRYQDNQEDGNSVIIGGVIAPIVTEQIIDEESIGRYWDYCAGIVKPCGHSIQEAIEWLEGNWDLESLSSDDRHMTTQRSNIAMNRFPEKYGYPNISPEMTDEEIVMRIKEGHTRRQAAQETTDEQLGVRLRGYRILDTPRNQSLYDEGYAEFESRMAEHSQNMRKGQPDHPVPPATEQARQNAAAYLFIEETEAWVSGIGVGAEPLCRKLGNYIGISKEDIETRSPRFMGYVYNLAKEGTIPTLQEFCDGTFNQ